MPTYRITEDLYVQAMSYAQQRSRKLVIGVCVVVPAAIYVMKGFPRETAASVLIVYLILAFYFLVLAPMINRLNYRRSFRNNPMLHKPQRVEIGPEEILFGSENGESRYRLDELRRLQVFPEMVLVYPTSGIFHLIPREVLSEQELERLEAHQRR